MSLFKLTASMRNNIHRMHLIWQHGTFDCYSGCWNNVVVGGFLPKVKRSWNERHFWRHLRKWIAGRVWWVEDPTSVFSYLKSFRVTREYILDFTESMKVIAVVLFAITGPQLCKYKWGVTPNHNVLSKEKMSWKRSPVRNNSLSIHCVTEIVILHCHSWSSNPGSLVLKNSSKLNKRRGGMWCSG